MSTRDRTGGVSNGIGASFFQKRIAARQRGVGECYHRKKMPKGIDRRTLFCYYFASNYRCSTSETEICSIRLQNTPPWTKSSRVPRRRPLLPTQTTRSSYAKTRPPLATRCSFTLTKLVRGDFSPRQKKSRSLPPTGRSRPRGRVRLPASD